MRQVTAMRPESASESGGRGSRPLSKLNASGPKIASRFAGRQSYTRRASGRTPARSLGLKWKWPRPPEPMAMRPKKNCEAFDAGYVAGMPAAGSFVDRAANLVVTVVPLALIAVAISLSWGGALVWQDIVIFFATLIPFGVGIAVGFHRLFTPASFKTSAAMRFVWAVLGSMALEGPVIEWVAYHRRHHRFSDA